VDLNAWWMLEEINQLLFFSRGANIFGKGWEQTAGHVTPSSHKAKQQKEVNTQIKIDLAIQKSI
jgi:hypothetical protein